MLQRTSALFLNSFTKGCHNKVLQAARLNFYYIFFFHFLTVWEARSLRSRCEKGWFPLGLLFLACRWLSSSCVPTWPSFCVFVFGFVFYSVAQSCLTLCVPMDCSTPGFPVLHHLLEFAQTHAHESVMPSNHLIQCCALLLPSISPSISVSRLPLPIRIFIMFGFRPTLMTSCLPSVRARFPSAFTLSGTRVRMLTCEFVGETIQPVIALPWFSLSISPRIIA